MGRKQDLLGGGGGQGQLTIKVPSFFRCPISLDVMKSPVSLCTGVTYDRASIQRWLESGNAVCPATMQPLPSTDLVPNLTLHRLISLWGSHPHASPKSHPLADLRSAADPAPALRRLAAFFRDEDVDEFEKNRLIAADGLAEILNSLLARNNSASHVEIIEEIAGVVAGILSSDCIEMENKKIVISAIAGSLNLSGSVNSSIIVLRFGRDLEARANAAAVIAAVLAHVSPPEAESSKVLIAEKRDLIPELIRLVSDARSASNAAAIDSGLSCLVGLTGVRRARVRMVRLGLVPVLTGVLAADAAMAPAPAAEKAMKLMEAAAGCADGREAICEAAEATVPAVLKRMMKAGKDGTEAAAVVLWSVCHLFRDRRAQEAVEASGGLTKILLLMQSDCSPAVRQMAGDLLKIFRVNAKCCLAGYDTKTTHIMPF